ncbi:MAG: class I SAM-dependent methyltransferase [Candidatus Hydrogenedentota bacterium]
MVHFDRHAPVYNETLDSAISSSGYTADTVLLPKLSACREIWMRRHAPHPLRFLDYGCGPGRFAALFKNEFESEAHYFGIDVSEKSLREARVRSGMTGGFGTREAPPYLPDQKFDIIMAAGVFHHIPPSARPKEFSWLRDLLDPDGSLLIWEHNPWNPVTRKIVRLCDFDYDAQLISAPALKKLLRTAGYGSITVDFRTFFPYRLRKLDALMTWCPFGGQYSIEARP